MSDHPKAAYTIDTFCDAYEISRATYYRLKTAGQGPEEIYIGNSPRITVAAAQEWERRRPRSTNQRAAASA